MARYIDEILQPGEKVLYSTNAHWIFYLPAIVAWAVALVLLILSATVAVAIPPAVLVAWAGAAIAALVAVYFTWGQVYSLFPSMSGDYFGTKNATSNYAVLYTAKGVASIIGGYSAAVLYEQSGSWAMGFYGSAVMALIAAGIAVYLRAGSPSVRAKAAGIPATA